MVKQVKVTDYVSQKESTKSGNFLVESFLQVMIQMMHNQVTQGKNISQ